MKIRQHFKLTSIWIVVLIICASVSDSGQTVVTNMQPGLDKTANIHAPYGFEVEGTFAYDIYGTNNDRHIVTGSFSVIVNGCKWNIRTSRTDESVDYFEAGSIDGQQIYFLGSHTNDILREHPLSARVNDTNDYALAFASIYAGTVPHLIGAEEISMLWLSYASSCYFNSRTNNQIEPVYWFGGQAFFDNGLTLPGQWQLENSSPNLPQKVVYFNDGFIRGYDGSGFPETVLNPKPYDVGYTNAIYQVMTFCTVGLYRIPSTFNLNLYSRKTSPKSNLDISLFRTFDFKVTNSFVLSANVNLIPKIPGLTVVRDRRLSHGSAPIVLEYEIRSNWPTIDQVKKEPQFPLMAQNIPVETDSVSKKRLVFLALMLFTWAVPVLFMLINQKRKKKI